MKSTTFEHIQAIIDAHLKFYEDFISGKLEKTPEDLLYDGDCTLGTFLKHFLFQSSYELHAEHRRFHYLCSVIQFNINCGDTIQTNQLKILAEVSENIVKILKDLQKSMT
jgi:hypothetical protein